MPPCKHQKMVLLSPQNKKLRCRHCHLTIDEEELKNDYCPECYDVDGMKRCDFDNLRPADEGKTRYSCEECGAIAGVVHHIRPPHGDVVVMFDGANLESLCRQCHENKHKRGVRV